MAVNIQAALIRATGAYDQCLACVDEISRRVPAAMSFACREGGPIQSAGVMPEMSPGEWEILRKLAQLGWAHFGVKVLTEVEERGENEGPA